MGRRAHVGAVAASPERGSRPVHELPLPRSTCPASSRRKTCYRRSPRAHRRPDAVYTFPSLSWGTSTQSYGDLDSRELRDDLSITTGTAHVEVRRRRPELADPAVDPASRTARGRSTRISRSTRRTSRRSCRSPARSRSSPRRLRQLSTSTRRTSCGTTYVEDEWKPAAGVTLNLGLRYDYQVKVFNQGDADSEGQRRIIFPTTGTATSLAPLVDFSTARRQEQLRPARRPRVGREERQQDGRARGLRALLQPDEHADRAGGDPELPPAERDDREPDLSGSVRRPRPDHVRLDRRRRTSRSRPTTSRTCSRRPTPAASRRRSASALAIHVDGVYNKMTKVPMAIDINPRSGGTTGTRPLPQFARVLQTQSIGFMRLQGAARPPREAARPQLHVHGVVHAGEHQRQRQQLGLTLSTVTDSAHIDYDNGSEQQRPAPRARRERLGHAAGDVTLGGGLHRAVDDAVQRDRGRRPQRRRERSPTTCPGRRATCSTAATTTRRWRRSTRIARAATSRRFRHRRSTRTSSTASICGRASRSRSAPSRRVELVAQVFNLLNRTNLLAAWQTNALSPAFGTITSAANKRQAELAVRFLF